MKNGTRPLEPEVATKTRSAAGSPGLSRGSRDGLASKERDGGSWPRASALYCAIVGTAVYLSSRRHPVVMKYTQLTDFTDSAIDSRFIAGRPYPRLHPRR